MDDGRCKNHNYCPNIITRGREPIDFSCFRLSEYVHTALDQKIMQNTDHADTNAYTMTEYDSISKVLEEYYASKNIYTRIRQKSVDLRKIVSTALERNRKKYQLQQKQLKDTEKGINTKYTVN